MNRRLVCTLVLLSLVISGCSYDRTFMQMDSNSPVPFFGFQWSVDSGQRAPDDDRESGPVAAPRFAIPLLRSRGQLAGRSGRLARPVLVSLRQSDEG